MYTYTVILQTTINYYKLINIQQCFLLFFTTTPSLVSPVDVFSLTTTTGELQFGSEATFTCSVRGGRAPYKVEMKVGKICLIVRFI